MSSLVNVQTVTTSTALDVQYDTFFLDASRESLLLKLPPLSENSPDGQNFTIRRIDSNGSNSVTVAGFNDEQNVDGNSAVSLSPGQSTRVINTGKVWYRHGF